MAAIRLNRDLVVAKRLMEAAPDSLGSPKLSFIKEAQEPAWVCCFEPFRLSIVREFALPAPFSDL